VKLKTLALILQFVLLGLVLVSSLSFGETLLTIPQSPSNEPSVLFYYELRLYELSATEEKAMGLSAAKYGSEHEQEPLTLHMQSLEALEIQKGDMQMVLQGQLSESYFRADFRPGIATILRQPGYLRFSSESIGNRLDDSEESLLRSTNQSFQLTVLPQEYHLLNGVQTKVQLQSSGNLETHIETTIRMFPGDWEVIGVATFHQKSREQSGAKNEAATNEWRHSLVLLRVTVLEDASALQSQSTFLPFSSLEGVSHLQDPDPVSIVPRPNFVQGGVAYRGTLQRFDIFGGFQYYYPDLFFVQSSFWWNREEGILDPAEIGVGIPVYHELALVPKLGHHTVEGTASTFLAFGIDDFTFPSEHSMVSASFFPLRFVFGTAFMDAFEFPLEWKITFRWFSDGGFFVFGHVGGEIATSIWPETYQLGGGYGSPWGEIQAGVQYSRSQSLFQPFISYQLSF